MGVAMGLAVSKAPICCLRLLRSAPGTHARLRAFNWRSTTSSECSRVNGAPLTSQTFAFPHSYYWLAALLSAVSSYASGLRVCACTYFLFASMFASMFTYFKLQFHLTLPF